MRFGEKAEIEFFWHKVDFFIPGHWAIKFYVDWFDKNKNFKYIPSASRMAVFLMAWNKIIYRLLN